MPTDMLAVGVVTSTHGTTGELKVRCFAGSPENIVRLRDALFRKGSVEKTLRMVSVRPQPPGVLVRIEGLDSPEKARSLVGYEIWMPRGNASPLAAGEFYEADLCRCRLWFGGEEIGPVRSLWDGGPAQLLEVQGKDGRTFLVPFTDHFIGEVDPEARRMVLKVDEILR